MPWYVQAGAEGPEGGLGGGGLSEGLGGGLGGARTGDGGLGGGLGGDGLGGGGLGGGPGGGLGGAKADTLMMHGPMYGSCESDVNARAVGRLHRVGCANKRTT